MKSNKLKGLRLLFMDVLYIFILFVCIETHSADYQLPEINSIPKIDGKMDKSEWNNALNISINYEIYPHHNKPAPVETQCFIMADKNNLYVGFKAYVPDPNKLKAFLRDRDEFGNDDLVGIVLDPFNQAKLAYELYSNPYGVQADIVNNEITGNISRSWDALWTSAAQITDFGYTVEMAIPFASIPTPKKQLQTWKINFVRFYPGDTRYTLTSIPEDKSNTCYLCQLKTLKINHEIDSHSTLRITPTFVMRHDEYRIPGTDNEWQGEGTDYDGSVDLRWDITTNNTLNATVNPDFSQVEADAAQLDVNTQFTLFLPEKRFFFLDNAEYFSTHANTFYSRNIVLPDYGIKFTGRTGDHTYGLITSRDTVTNFLIPGIESSFVASYVDENGKNIESDITVLRYNKNINVGALITKRQAADYTSNLYSFDGHWQFNKSSQLKFQYMQSNTDYPLSIRINYQQQDNISDNAYLLNIRHNTTAWDFNIDYLHYGDDFRADVGFINRVGYNQTDIGVVRKFYGEENSWWNNAELSFTYDQSDDLSDNLLDKEYETSFSIGGPLQSRFEISTKDKKQVYLETTYNKFNYSWSSSFRPSRTFYILLGGDFGDNIDYIDNRLGKSNNYNLTLTWNASKHIEMNVSLHQQNLKISGDSLFSALVSDIRATYQFDIRSFLRFTLTDINVDYNPDNYQAPWIEDSIRDQNIEVLYSYKLTPQTLFYVGYSDTALVNNVKRHLFKTKRSIFMKLSYSWQ